MRLVAAAQRVQDDRGGAAVLVKNGGVMLLGPFISKQREEQRRMVEVNLLRRDDRDRGLLDQRATAAATS